MGGQRHVGQRDRRDPASVRFVADQWKDAAFSGIYAGNGLVVSAEMRGGKPANLEIENVSGRDRQIECLFGTDRGGNDLA